MKKIVILAIIALTLTSHKPYPDFISKLEGFSFRATDSSKWGMIALDGRILFADKFVNQPSVIMDGIFMVKNAGDRYELFQAKANPTRIDTTSYIDIGMFTHNVTPAVVDGESVVLVDKSGKVTSTIDKRNGKIVTRVTNFYEGFAIYTTIDYKKGMIDTAGNVHIDAIYDNLTRYDNGFAIGSIWSAKKRDRYLIDKSGKALSIKSLQNRGIWQSSGVVIIPKNNQDACYDIAKREIIKLDSTIYIVSSFTGDYAIFTDKNSKWGVINKKGEIVIPAKYNEYSYYLGGRGSNDQNFICKDFAICTNDDHKVLFCDFNGKVIVTTKYKRVLPFFNNKNAVAFDGKQWVVIDTKGNECSVKFDELGSYGPYQYTNVTSDNSKVDALVDYVMDIFAANIYKIGENPKTVLKTLAPDFDIKTLNSYNNWDIDPNIGFNVTLPFASNIEIDISLDFTYDQAPFKEINIAKDEVKYRYNNKTKLSYISIDIGIREKYNNKTEEYVSVILNRIKATNLFTEPILTKSSENIDYFCYTSTKKDNTNLLLDVYGSEDGFICIVLYVND